MIRDMRPAEDLAASKPHGSRIRYRGGCRCMLCRAANSRYETQRSAERRAGRSNPVVSSKRVARHLERLTAAGIGRRTISRLTGIGQTTIQKLHKGRRGVRRMHAMAILAIKPHGATNAAQILDAAATWRLLDDMLAFGLSRVAIARELGSKAKTPALQIKRDRVIRRNAQKVETLHRRLFPWKYPHPEDDDSRPGERTQ